MIRREGILVQQTGGIGGERDALLGPWTAAEGRTVLGLGLARGAVWLVPCRRVGVEVVRIGVGPEIGRETRVV